MTFKTNVSITSAEVDLTPLGVLALWTSCALTAAVGLGDRSLGTRPPVVTLMSAQSSAASAVDVEIEPVTPQSAGRSQAVAAPIVPPADVAPAASVPPMPPLATVLPAAAFAVVEKSPQAARPSPTTVPVAKSNPTPAVAMSAVASASAQKSSAAPSGSPGAAAVQQLVYGQGEGVQPPPLYPREAQLGRQQGVVVVRFEIDSTGAVTAADAVTKCPWPLLNQSAVRTVKETWHFAAGNPRTFNVAIQFRLQRN